MRFTSAAAVAALATGVAANYNSSYYEAPSYTTEVVTEYTTYCPGPTMITHSDQTYTVTEATTLTITNCPCTVTYPVHSTYAPPPTTYAPPPATYTPPPYNNGTTYAPPPPAPSSPTVYVPPTSAVPVPTGAANKAVAASGAGLAAVLGFVAYVL
jgi:hypothetical protein